MTGQYNNQKVTCTKLIDVAQTEEDGDPCGCSYVYHFSNGDFWEFGYRFAVKGNTVYSVYLNGNKLLVHFSMSLNIYLLKK